MEPVHQTIEIDAPREQVFEYLADLADRPGFTAPYQTEYRLERLRSCGVGAAARFTVKPGSRWATTEIERLEPPHRITEKGRTGTHNRVPTVTVWELVESPGGLTRVTVTYFTRPRKPIDRLRESFRRAAHGHSRGLEESLRRLRGVLEDREAPRVRARVAGGNRHPTGVV